MSRALISAAFIILFCAKIACAIDTKDWETKGFTFMFAEASPQWLANAGYQIMGGAYPKKDEKYFYKFINTDTNTITVKPAKPWHDIIKLEARYEKTDKNNAFVVAYYIKGNVMTLLDVIGRYGLEHSSIKTEDDLSKEVTYTYTDKIFNDEFSRSENVKSSKLYYMSNEVMKVTFRSIDKVFVDAIIFAFIPKTKP